VSRRSAPQSVLALFFCAIYRFNSSLAFFCERPIGDIGHRDIFLSPTSGLSESLVRGIPQPIIVLNRAERFSSAMGRIVSLTTAHFGSETS
jgi:hypothetical protein